MTATPPDYSEEQAGQARAWVVRLASGECDAEQRQAFAAWLQHSAAHRQAFDDERALWQAMAQAENQLRAQVADDARAAARPRAAGPVRSRRRVRWWAGAAAAALALAVVLPLQAWRWQADHRAGHAVKTVALEDGSTLMLDAGAAIRVDFDSHQRRLELLRGRAWFRVAHGDPRPFQVEAGQGVTRDIGTAFEVALQPDAVQAAVTDGEVEVRAAGTVVRLRAGQAAHYAKAGPVSMPRALSTASIASWREGDIVLEQRRPGEAIAEIARYYPGRVLVFGELGTQPVSGVFRSDRAGDAIRSVAALAGAQVRTLPGGWLWVRPVTEKVNKG